MLVQTRACLRYNTHSEPNFTRDVAFVRVRVYERSLRGLLALLRSAVTVVL